MEPLLEHDPRRLGDFTLIGRLGSGGMGSVYLGARGTLNAAIKVMHPALLQDPSARTRFEREIEILEKISSPFVAKILEHGFGDNQGWFATEFINGPDLKSLVEERGPLDDSTWDRLASELLAGLASIHRAGIIHRDIKPSNLVLSDGGLKIVDFGIAQISDMTSVTVSGLISGSPAWFSPEQIEGKLLSPATDLFSAGSVLTYAATGKSPWGAADEMTKAMVFGILVSEPDLSGLTQRQKEIVAPLLNKEAAHRKIEIPVEEDFLTERGSAQQSSQRPPASKPGRPAPVGTTPGNKRKKNGPLLSVIATVSVLLAVTLAYTAPLISNRNGNSNEESRGSSSGESPTTEEIRAAQDEFIQDGRCAEALEVFSEVEAILRREGSSTLADLDLRRRLDDMSSEAKVFAFELPFGSQLRFNIVKAANTFAINNSFSRASSVLEYLEPPLGEIREECA